MSLTLSELWRRLQNIIVTAEVVRTKSAEGKMLVQVKYGEESTSDWLPCHSKSNNFMKIWLPPQVGEQVTVLRPFGVADGGIILPSLFSKGCKEPTGATATNTIVEFSDGARFEYDTENGTLKCTAIEEIILTAENLTIEGDLNIKGSVDIADALEVGGSIATESTITDARGDLSNFTTSDGAHRA